MNTVFLYIAFYLVHFVLTYLVQRQIIKVSKFPEYHPVSFMLFLCFIPFVGLFASLIVLLMELTQLWNGDYKKIYRIRNKKET